MHDCISKNVAHSKTSGSIAVSRPTPTCADDFGIEKSTYLELRPLVVDRRIFILTSTCRPTVYRHVSLEARTVTPGEFTFLDVVVID